MTNEERLRGLEIYVQQDKDRWEDAYARLAASDAVITALTTLLNAHAPQVAQRAAAVLQASEERARRENKHPGFLEKLRQYRVTLAGPLPPALQAVLPSPFAPKPS
jgi:hypothetical protein